MLEPPQIVGADHRAEHRNRKHKVILVYWLHSLGILLSLAMTAVPRMLQEILDFHHHFPPVD
jgi:hypothetical protein